MVGWPEAAGPVVYNAASVLRDGAIEATYRKRELPNYAVFDERRYFAADDVPCVFECAGAQVGLLICEDLWFPEPAAAAARLGAQLLRGAQCLAVRARQVGCSATRCWPTACARPASASPT